MNSKQEMDAVFTRLENGSEKKGRQMLLSNLGLDNPEKFMGKNIYGNELFSEVLQLGRKSCFPS